jgi:hypothetical protein
VPDVVAAQPPAVRDLEQDRVTVGREPALPAQRCSPVDFIVGTVKEGLKLAAGERAPARRRFAPWAGTAVFQSKQTWTGCVPKYCSQVLSQPESGEAAQVQKARNAAW